MRGSYRSAPQSLGSARHRGQGDRGRNEASPITPLQRRVRPAIAFKLETAVGGLERTQRSLSSYQFESMRLVFNVSQLKSPMADRPETTARQIIRCIRRRRWLAMAGLVMTWGLICGFVLLAMLKGWKL